MITLATQERIHAFVIYAVIAFAMGVCFKSDGYLVDARERQMTNLTHFQVRRTWLAACGFTGAENTFRVIREIRGNRIKGDFFERMFIVDRGGFEWTVAIGRGRLVINPENAKAAQAATLAFFAHTLPKPVYSYASSDTFQAVPQRRSAETTMLRQFFPDHTSTTETKRGAAWISRAFHVYRRKAARYATEDTSPRGTPGYGARLAQGCLKQEHETTLTATLRGSRSPSDGSRWLASRRNRS